jgi:murein DD-endopeptidase MepM/ murein hydrolase activator NlpD
MILAIVSAVLIVVVGLFCLIAYTPIRTFIPGYPDAYTRRQAVQNAQRIDSLETRIIQWQLYSENLRRVVSGEEPIRMDSLILGSRGSSALPSASFLDLRDSLLRADVQAQEQFGVSSQRRNLPIEAQTFFPPIKGVVSKGFDATVHPWTDITAPAGTMVMSVLDGTVISTGWDQDKGYSIILQHQGDIISIYRNNQKLLHKVGDAVKAGTPVALLASSPSLTKGDHLHFELWYGGHPQNPADYISF